MIRLRSSHSIGGARAQRSGSNFELAIMGSAAVSPHVILYALPKCGARFTGPRESHALPMPCDFIGAVKGTGRAIVFDAKSCNDVYGIDLANPKIVKPHQARFLLNMDECNAVAGLLVECKRRMEYRWLPGSYLVAARTFMAWHSPAWLILGPVTRHVDFGWTV